MSETARNSATDDDSEALRAALQGVRPRAPSERHTPARPTPSARPLQREADERAVMHELAHAPMDFDALEAGDALAYHGPGLQHAAWTRLRRGAYRVGAVLDLHGDNRERAYQRVSAFLAHQHAIGVQCVRIIHGKGLGSPNSGPVLKALVDRWLRRRSEVLAFCSARPHDGGTGAVYVLLRRS